MASSSSSSQIRKYHVFPSFHGPDVRKGFLSHLHFHFARKGITTFKDQEIERGHTIGPELVQAIRESRVSIVVLSKKYASSSWCLGELVEIFNCKDALGQIVMTIFFDVDPSDVRTQKGEFGSAFEKTCEGKSEEVKQRWRKALTDVANIAGEDSFKRANEAEMIQKIATDVSGKLNATPSRDFEDMVGLEAHLTNMNSLLHLESNDVKMIGIWGPAGIGKSTITRALFNQLSSSFPLSCFMENLEGSYKSYDSKLSLQSLLLSNILKQKDMRVYQLGAVEDWLQDQRVLIILDDVDDLEKLEVLAKELSWFGSGSRIIVTTKDKKILTAHGINQIYHVDFPSKKDSLEIFCRSAFKQSSVPYGFEELAKKVVDVCGNLPLGLSVVGSSLRGESKHKWELQLSTIETSLDRKIENTLRLGYDRLSKKYQSLFLHIACLFNNHDVNYVTSVLADSNLDVGNGLNTLAEKSLVHTNGSIVMHSLLQQLGRQIVFEQAGKPGKRQFLVEVEEILDVLANETGTGSVIGISLDKSKIGNDDNLSVGKRAFEGMRNLRLLRIYRRLLQIPEDMEYLPRLRLLHWDSYPRKSLPPRSQPECLVELHMQYSKLEKLWEGIKLLPNLKCIDLSYSFELKEIPNLLNATNLETLNLDWCSSLVELPSSIKNLHKLKKLKMRYCQELRDIPTNINLASLEEVDMSECWQLASFPAFSTNIRELDVASTNIEEVPSSIRNLRKLKKLVMRNCQKLQVIPTNINLPSLEVFIVNRCSRLESFPDISSNIRHLDVGNTKIKDVPPLIVSWSRLEWLDIGSSSLKRLTHVPLSVRMLHANGCVSLERVCFSFPNKTMRLSFYNCIRLDEESRRGIIQQSIQGDILLPGEQIPTEFTHKATRNSITIPLASFSASSRFKACILLSPIEQCLSLDISCRLRSKGDFTIDSVSTAAWLSDDSYMPSWSKHLFIFSGDLFPQQNRCQEADVTISEIIFEFSIKNDDKIIDDKIIECGVEIMTKEAEGRQIVFEQSGELGNRQLLEEVEEIRDVQANETGTGSVIGISLDMSKISNNDKFSVVKRAFEGMRNLPFPRIYGDWLKGYEAVLQIPADMEYLPRIRSLHWIECPRKDLSPGFQPDHLVELYMPYSKLEKLWEGIQPLPNLKSIDLSRSFKLKEIPNLLTATNLEILILEYCSSLVKLPSSIRNLHKLKKLKMRYCQELRVIPTNIDLASLEEVDMSYCTQLRSFPDFSSNIMLLRVESTQIELVPSFIRYLHKLERLYMSYCQELRVIPTNINLPSLEVVDMSHCLQLASFPDISSNIMELSLGNTKIKDVPPSIVSWSRLELLDIGSRSLKRLTHVPLSVRVLRANGCVSLKRVCCSFPNQTKKLSFYNCIQLDEESRRGIIQQSIQGNIILPGKEIPAEFTHKATGNSITITLASFSASSKFKACILLSPIEQCLRRLDISCRLRSKGDVTIRSVSTEAWLSNMPSWSEHLFIFSGDLFPQQNRCQKVDVTISEIIFEFSIKNNDDKIIECGVEIMTEEAEGSS